MVRKISCLLIAAILSVVSFCPSAYATTGNENDGETSLSDISSGSTIDFFNGDEGETDEGIPLPVFIGLFVGVIVLYSVYDISKTTRKQKKKKESAKKMRRNIESSAEIEENKPITSTSPVEEEE